MKKIILVLSVSAAFLIHGCAKNPVTGKKEVVLMSEEQELAMGKSADPQIVQEFGLYEDKALQEYLNTVGQKIAKVSHRNNIPYTFRLLDAELINAFALPGGYVYFTRGILAHFNNEAELMGVLGHEVGHVAARHSVSQQRNQIFGQVGLIAGLVLAPDLAPMAESAQQGLGLLFLKFGRDAEKQSDELGVEYSTKLGYDATKMAEFFKTLERQDQQRGQVIPEFLSTHPNPGNRYVTVGELAKQWKAKQNLTNPMVNRNEYLRRINGLIYGDDPKQGYIENNIFYHPVLRFQLPIPAGWNAQNSPQSFQMATQDGSALMLLTLASGQSLQDAASAAAEKYKLRVVESRPITVNGLEAFYVLADQAQQSGTVRTTSYYIRHNGAIYHIIGAASLANWDRYAGSFTETMNGFRVLTDPGKINRKADRIMIKQVNGETTLRDALKANNIPDSRLEEFAILNGMALTDRLGAGTLIKVLTR